MNEGLMDTKFRAVVVDDQHSARRGVALALRSMDEVEITAEFCDGESALNELGSLRPDLVFVDIQMPRMGGLEFARRAELDSPAAFIFVTAYDEHAVAAFELAAVDYVLKPFTDDRLITATRRGIERVQALRNHATLETLRHTLDANGEKQRHSNGHAGTQPRYVTVREDDRIQLVPISEIAWVKADRNYVRLYTGSQEHLVRTGLSKMLDWLGQGRFIRVHRSHAVNVDAVREIQPWFNGDYVALMRGGEKLKISRRYKDAILKRVL